MTCLTRSKIILILWFVFVHFEQQLVEIGCPFSRVLRQQALAVAALAESFVRAAIFACIEAGWTRAEELSASLLSKVFHVFILIVVAALRTLVIEQVMDLSESGQALSVRAVVSQERSLLLV